MPDQRNTIQLYYNDIEQYYGKLKEIEKYLKISHSNKNKPLKKLYTKEVDTEQIYQQIEIQTKSILDENAFKGFNLYHKIASLSLLEENSDDQESSDKEESEDEDAQSDLSDKISTEDEESDLSDLEGESDEDHSINDSNIEEENEEQDSLDNMSEEEFDKDTFGDLAVEGQDTDSEDEESKDLSDEAYDSGNEELYDDEKKKFKTSAVDSKFLNLRESEYIADNDLIGKSIDIDLMEIMDSDDDDNDAMYEAFFDPPQKTSSNTESKSEQIGVAEKEQEQQSEEEQQEECNRQPTERKIMSRFEAEMRDEEFQKETVEEDNYVLEKPWAQQGEATKEQRPVDSVLEEQLEYNINTREKPVITEDITEMLERLILSRIKTQSWDDVERKIRPSTTASQYKQKIVLNEEKSTKSLTQIYEEDYMKTQKSEEAGGSSMILGTKDIEEDIQKHKEIKDELAAIFSLLDPLTNYHYTPKPRNAELKIVSNLSALTMEEQTPMTATDATLLAPQEIVAPLKGDLKSDREKTSTDRKRERRAKKLHQKKRSKYEDEILKLKSQKTDKHGLLHKDASISVVQRAIKTGQVKTLDQNETGKMNSSKKFFKEFSALKRKSADPVEGKAKIQKLSNKKRKSASKDCSSISKVLL